MLKSASIYTILKTSDLITTIPIQRISSKMPVLQETSPNMLSPTKKSVPLSKKRIMERQMASGLFEKERAFDTICVNYSFHDQQRSYR